MGLSCVGVYVSVVWFVAITVLFAWLLREVGSWGEVSWVVRGMLGVLVGNAGSMVARQVVSSSRDFLVRGFFG